MVAVKDQEEAVQVLWALCVALSPGKTSNQMLEDAGLPPHVLELPTSMDEPSTSTVAAMAHPTHYTTPQTLWFGTQIPEDQLEPEDMEEASDLEASTDDEGNAEEDAGLPDFSGLNPVHPNPMEIQTTSQNTGLKVPLQKLPQVSDLLDSRLPLSPLAMPIWPIFCLGKTSLYPCTKAKRVLGIKARTTNVLSMGVIIIPVIWDLFIAIFVRSTGG